MARENQSDVALYGWSQYVLKTCGNQAMGIIALASPQLITDLVEILGKPLGLWLATPPYDAEGNFVLGDELYELPYSAWEISHNQNEIARRFRGGGDLATNDRVLVELSIPQSVLEEAFPSQIVNDSPEAMWNHGLSRINRVGWFASAIDPDAECIVFFFAPNQSQLLESMLKKKNRVPMLRISSQFD